MTLLLVDGTNVVMRYASVMIEKDAEITNADRDRVLRAVMKAFAECAQAMEATHLIVALDSVVGSWRRERFPAYKAARTVSTTEWSNRLAMHCIERGVKVVRVAGFEADDALATLVARSEKSGRECCVLSGDSDLLQLSSLLTRVVQFGMKGEPRFVVRSMEWTRQKFGLASAGLLTLYKALVGETGDGLPGVPGIGPVKAHKLLSLAQTAEEITMLLKGEVEMEAFKLALELVTLRTDAPIEPIVPSECRINAHRMVTT